MVSDFKTVVIWTAAIAFVVSAAVAWLLVHTRDLHLHLTGDHPGSGPQKMHADATPRIGGTAVLAGLLAGLSVPFLMGASEASEALGSLRLVALSFGLMPLFALGLVEDVSKAVSVRLRLFVALAGGAVAYYLAGVRIQTLGIPGIDTLLSAVPAVSLMLTLVAVAGLVHAMNIVDGLNGLLAGITIVILGALALVAHRFGEVGLYMLALIGMAATAGFAVFNFPLGRLFCGDAGAYLIGYLVAVMVISLVLRQPAISPWFALAVVIHPVTETLYSAWRRWRNGQSPTHPDARHMHSLWAANLRQRADETGLLVALGENAGASLRTQAVACLPVAAAATWPTETPVLLGICLAYVTLFIAVVRMLERSVYGQAASRYLTDEPR